MGFINYKVEAEVEAENQNDDELSWDEINPKSSAAAGEPAPL